MLFFLGQFLLEDGQDRKALVAYERLVKKHLKSKYLPDAWLAFGDYFFNNSKGKRTELERALEAYKRAAEFTESQVYAYALYKQGWCYFNMADYQAAKDKFKTVVLYGELAGAAAEKDGGKSGKSGLVKEARGDYVRTYARDGDVMTAKDDFSKVATKPEDRFTMSSAGEPLLRRWQGPRGGHHLQRPHQGEAAVARVSGLPGEDRRPRAAHGQQGAHRGPGAPPGEDHQGSGGLRHRQGGQGQETAGRGQRAGRAHPVQPRRHLAQRGAQDA